MDELIGTRNCPHLGFDVRNGTPCCHADEMTRVACGRFVPNPAARKSSGLGDVAEFFCAALGHDALPADAVRAAAQERARTRQQEQRARGFQAPHDVRGVLPAKPDRSAQPQGDADPIIPTHTLKNESRDPMPNDPCPCGSGRKFKKCCGR